MPYERFLQLTGAGLGSLTDDPNNDRTIADLAGGGGGSLSVTDGTHTVNPATEIDFTSGATVTDGGSGIAQVAITGGGGGGGLQIGELGWNEQAPDNRTVVNPGHTDLSMNTAISSPPDFLDNNGFIQTFGIYSAYLAIKVLSSGTAGQFLYISSPFNMGIPIDLDAATGYTDPDYAYNTPPDIVCLATNSDLNAVGFGEGGFGWHVSLPSSATGWSLSVLPFLLQVAHL
jgi:hypothetical protein